MARIVAPLPPGSRVDAAVASGLILLLPVLAAYPLIIVLHAFTAGAPLPCPADANASECGYEARQRSNELLLSLGLWMPLVLFVLTVAAVIVLIALRRRSWIVAILGVGLMAVSIITGFALT